MSFRHSDLKLRTLNPCMRLSPPTDYLIWIIIVFISKMYRYIYIYIERERATRKATNEGVLKEKLLVLNCQPSLQTLLYYGQATCGARRRLCTKKSVDVLCDGLESYHKPLTPPLPLFITHF